MDTCLSGRRSRELGAELLSHLKRCILGSSLTSLFSSQGLVYPSIKWKNGLCEPTALPALMFWDWTVGPRGHDRCELSSFGQLEMERTKWRDSGEEWLCPQGQEALLEPLLHPHPYHE